MKKGILPIGLMCLMLFLPSVVTAQSQNSKICATYFTGIGCPHCAKADPLVLQEMVKEHPRFLVMEYEIYQLRENAPILQEYDSKYNTGLGVPLIIFGRDDAIKGDRPIMNNLEARIENLQKDKCLTPEGEMSFKNLSISELPGKPKIWTDERILIKEGSGNVSDEVLGELLTENPKEALKDISSQTVEPEPVALSGSRVRFKNAARVDGWLLQWDFKENAEPRSNDSGSFDTSSILILGVVIITGIVIAWGLKR